jgi:hypothetical protein
MSICLPFKQRDFDLFSVLLDLPESRGWSFYRYRFPVQELVR